MTTVELVYFNAGGGHRAAAAALAEVLAARPEPWTVRRVDLVDLLDPDGHFRRVTGFEPERYYNVRLARGWTLGLAQELKLLQGLIRLGHERMANRLKQHWQQSRPDLVVSLIPNFNRALQAGLSRARPAVPFVTVMTDMADYPPNFWMEAPRGQHIVCGTLHALHQARALNYPEGNIHLTSGMIIRPDFYVPTMGDSRAEFERLNLDPSRPTGVVMFGGEGSMSMLKIAAQLGDIQLILLCGRNARLAAALRAKPATAPRAIVGYTSQVRRHLELADFFIGKPGPGSISEAVRVGLPVVTIKNAWTMPQERFNATWVCENGLGLVAPSISKVRASVLEVLARLDEFKGRVRQIDNRAVFELPALLERIVESHVSASRLHVLASDRAP